MHGYAIGNSLGNIDISNYSDGPTIACNEFYREQTPDYIAAIDKPTVIDIQSQPRPFKFVTVRYFRNLHDYYVAVDDEPTFLFKSICQGMCNNTGILAVAFLVRHLKCDTVYMLNYDFYTGPHRHGYQIAEWPTLTNMWSIVCEELLPAKIIRIGDRTNMPPIRHMHFSEGIPCMDTQLATQLVR